MQQQDSDNDWRRLLSDAERQRMLQEIASVAPMVEQRLFGERTPDDLDITTQQQHSRKSPIERLGFILQSLPTLAQAVDQITRMPSIALERQTRRVSPPSRARRIEPAHLLRAVQRGHAGQWVHETATHLVQQTPEDRMVRAFLQRLASDAATISQIAESADEAEIALKAQQAARCLNSLSARLSSEEPAADFEQFHSVPTHRMLTHPVYAPLYAIMRRYRQSFAFDWTHPLFVLPGRETWRLYEAWGLFQTLRALCELGYSPMHSGGVSEQALIAIRQDRLSMRLAKGEASQMCLTSQNGSSVRVFYSRTYAAQRRSLSRTMQPDIVLERDDGRTWILDTKFKAYAEPGEEGDDIDQMHAYRDAIVASDAVSKPVARAWCLYTGQPDGEQERSIIAWGTMTQSVVGALRLRPGSPDDFLRLKDLIFEWLAS